MSETIDFGIDLGTTNSSIARCRAGNARIFQSEHQADSTPSVVYVGAGGRMLVGRRAYDAWVQDPDNTQAEFKRWMGFSDTMTFPAAGKTMSAEDLSAEVLKSLRGDVLRETGEDVSAAVITVPAAFGALQCDATARAARLAGLVESPLLQEPVAAAIAYGAAPGGRDQRWMVFDLGGGTLDIAIVSTRNGRLAILDHQGDNRMGGKDVDRVIAEELLLPPLSQQFAIPDRASDPRAFARLMRALVRRAEIAKIALGDAPDTEVELIDLGNDRYGKPIEISVRLTRAEIDARIQPILDRCVALARRALKGARVAGEDLDRVLLVGGPTRMPAVRAALASAVCERLDCSLDPMTVVATGAALYASTQSRAGAASVHVPATAGAVAIELSYERASGTLRSPVAGVIPEGAPVHEVKVDSEGGLWTSGWVPVTDGVFQVDVVLTDRKVVTTFNLTARDQSGRPVEVAPSEFSISYMLPMAAPPLPHTIAVELTSRTGESAFDPIFKRGCPLPAEAHRTYRADQTLKPSDQSATLPIKFWEVDVTDDPKEKWWAGCVHIRADKIRRPVVEGTELEVTMKIDASRRMTVEVFIPLLNQSFEEGVYIPDPPTARSQVQQQLDVCFGRLDRVWRTAYECERDDLIEEARALQSSLEVVAERAGTDAAHDNPDAEMGPAEVLRKVRVQLAQLEERLDVEGPSSFARQIRGESRWTDQVVQRCGTESDKSEMDRLRTQVDKYIETGDQRGLKWLQQQLGELRGALLDHQPWFWLNVLEHLKRPGRRFLNESDAQRWLEAADDAARRQDLPELRAAVIRVWEMQTPEQVELSKQRAAQSGLRTG